MRELTYEELEVVNGGILANIGMGVAGAAGAMAVYSLHGGITGQMSGAGFVGAAVSGFIYGASGFNPAGAIAGGAIGAAAQEVVETES